MVVADPGGQPRLYDNERAGRFTERAGRFAERAGERGVAADGHGIVSVGDYKQRRLARSADRAPRRLRSRPLAQSGRRRKIRKRRTARSASGWRVPAPGPRRHPPGLRQRRLARYRARRRVARRRGRDRALPQRGRRALRRPLAPHPPTSSAAAHRRGRFRRGRRPRPVRIDRRRLGEAAAQRRRQREPLPEDPARRAFHRQRQEQPLRPRREGRGPGGRPVPDRGRRRAPKSTWGSASVPVPT